MSLFKEEMHEKIQRYCCMGIAFCLPVTINRVPLLIPGLIMTLLFIWIAEGNVGEKFKNVFKNKFAVIFISFFLLHVIGLLYTSNMDSGLFDVQIKLAMLLFPILLVGNSMKKEVIDNVFFALIAGGITAALIMLGHATYLHITLGENDFFYEPFSSFLIHPSYIAMYLNLAIAWLLLNIVQRNFDGKRFTKIHGSLIVCFFTAIIVMLSSKTGLLVLLIQFIGFLMYYIVSRKKYLMGGSGIVFIFISLFAIYNFVPEIKGRVERALSAVSSGSNDQTQAESTAVRMLVWKAANQVISENFLFGTGTGDSKDELVKEYEKRGMTGALERKLNAHNEFYQVFVTLGVVGFILLLLSLFYPLFFSWKNARLNDAVGQGNAIYVLFLFILILNFLTESMFETQAGVMFYAFFNSLLCFYNQPTSTHNSTLNTHN